MNRACEYLSASHSSYIHLQPSLVELLALSSQLQLVSVYVVVFSGAAIMLATDSE